MGLKLDQTWITVVVFYI